MMEEEQIKEFKKQHIKTYKNAIIENIKNNTKSLVNDDIKSLIVKPPLDSMDSIKNKFLSVAKKDKIVLNTEELSKILDDYRKCLNKVLVDIEKERISVLSKKVEEYSFDSSDDVVVFYKKDFININKFIKKTVKNQLLIALEIVNKKIYKVFSKDVEDSVKDKFTQEVVKYLKSNYQKQLLDNLDIKVLVKDTTLINGIKESTDHYVFTLNNSKLLNLD